MTAHFGLNVVGIVVFTAPGKTDSVQSALALLPGVDIHSDTGDGRLVVTAIDTEASLAIDQLASMNRTPGVVSTMLAYHQVDRPNEVPAPCCIASDPEHHCQTKKRA